MTTDESHAETASPIEETRTVYGRLATGRHTTRATTETEEATDDDYAIITT